jgi:hypothetical protein
MYLCCMLLYHFPMVRKTARVWKEGRWFERNTCSKEITNINTFHGGVEHTQLHYFPLHTAEFILTTAFTPIFLLFNQEKPDLIGSSQLRMCRCYELDGEVPSSEIYSHWASQENQNLSWNAAVPHCVHKIPPPVPILSNIHHTISLRFIFTFYSRSSVWVEKHMGLSMSVRPCCVFCNNRTAGLIAEVTVTQQGTRITMQ